MKNYIKYCKAFYFLVFALFFLLLLSPSRLVAQQDSQFTQYMYNTVVINPAYASSRGLLSINSIYRNQWVGIEGAPETITASLNTPIGKKGVGLGFSLVHDKIGPSKETNLAVDFSYTIRTSYDTQLSFGIKSGFNLLDVDLNLVSGPLVGAILDPNASSVNGQLSPLIGAGVYYHSDKWYIGLSSPNIIKTKHNDAFVDSSVTEELHFYLIGGYVFDLSSDFKLKPAFLAKGVTGSPLSVDVSANFMFKERFTLGAAYRWDAAVSALAGIQVSDQVMIGYAYDYETTELTDFNSGSHEIFLRFELFTLKRRAINPRFF